MENDNPFNGMQLQMVLQSILQFKPELVKFYPMLESAINGAEKAIDDYLGDNEKMIVITRKNGRTGVVEFNSKVEFKLSNTFDIEAKENPILKQYSKEDYKNKLMESNAILSLRDRYNRMTDEEKETADPSMQDILSSIPNT